MPNTSPHSVKCCRILEFRVIFGKQQSITNFMLHPFNWERELIKAEACCVWVMCSECISDKSKTDCGCDGYDGCQSREWSMFIIQVKTEHWVPYRHSAPGALLLTKEVTFKFTFVIDKLQTILRDWQQAVLYLATYNSCFAGFPLNTRKLRTGHNHFGGSSKSISSL